MDYEIERDPKILGKGEAQAPVLEDMRDAAMAALLESGVAGAGAGAHSWRPRQQSGAAGLERFKAGINSLLSECGYDPNDPRILMSVSGILDNLSRL